MLNGKKAKEKKSLLICGAVILILLLVIALAFSIFTNTLTENIKKTNGELLEEYASNNAYAAKKELTNGLAIMKVMCNDFAYTDSIKSNETLKNIRLKKLQTPFSEVVISDLNGNGIDGNNVKYDYADKTYFKRALDGESTISSDDDMIVFTSPVVYYGKVKWIVYGYYDKFELLKAIETENLGGESYSIVIDESANIILDSSNTNRIIGSKTNLLDLKSGTSISNGLTVDGIKEKLYNNEKVSGIFTTGDGVKRQFFICPVGINRWYVVKFVTQTYVDGTIQPIKLDVALMTLVLIFCCVLIGITVVSIIQIYNRHKNDQLKEAYENVERANSAKSTFLSRMSHEIRTPMNAIVGLTKITRVHIDDKESVSGYLDKIDASSKILLRIINDVLDMSAIESNKMKIANAPFDIKEVLSSVSAVYYAQCSQKGVNFKMNVAGVTEEKLVGDSLRLNQILLNLISNAYKFTHSGGEIVVSVAQYINDKTAFLHISVKDSGEGMDEDMIKRLFKPFEQESAETAKKHGGSGLGLSIVKNLVELMHGEIEVKSEKNIGTTFFVNLPFGIQSTDEDDQKFENVKAMVVGHDSYFVDNVSKLLKNLGVTYLTAGNWNDAYALIEKNNNDKAVDFCIANGECFNDNSFDTLKKIKELTDSKLKIICTDYDVAEIKSRLDKDVVDIFVQSPLFCSDMKNVLLELDGKFVEEDKDITYDFGGKKVLLAEDNVLNTEIAVSLLEIVDLKCDCADNGKKAVEMFENSAEGTYDAILMDVQMPVMDGYEAAEKIRSSKHPQAKTIPMYAMTANAFTEDVENAIKAGMDGHISKPIDTKMLYKTLYKAIFKK